MNPQNLYQLFTRLGGYLRTEPFQIVIEFAIIWVAVFLIVRFLRGTRGARAIKGVFLLILAATLFTKVLGSANAFERLNFLYNNFLGYASLALVIVFHPELRRAFVRLGEARLFGAATDLRKARVIEAVLSAVAYMSKNKVGALIAIERDVDLRSIVDSGTELDAAVTTELIETIFWPGSALHDMGVVLRGERLVAAGVQFPLAEAEHFTGTDLGSRHRAAVGLSAETDALVIIVSEQTGTISLAERGKLIRPLTVDGLRSHLVRGLEHAHAHLVVDESSIAVSTE